MVKTGPAKEAQRWAEATLRHEDFVKQVAVLQASVKAEEGIVNVTSRKIADFVKAEAARTQESEYQCAITMTNGEMVLATLRDGVVRLEKLDTYA
jgi:hypothetical protein